MHRLLSWLASVLRRPARRHRPSACLHVERLEDRLAPAGNLGNNFGAAIGISHTRDGGDSSAAAVAIDAAGNIYVTGQFHGMSEFGGSVERISRGESGDASWSSSRRLAT